MIDWDKVNLPGDMSKESILGEIAEVSRIKATQHCSPKHPAFFSYDDLYQEIFLKCVSVLDKFEASKSFGNKHRLFFYKCADNLVLDMRRKHLFYRAAPCKQCDSFNKDPDGNGCNEYHNKEDCPILAKYEKLNKAKRDLGWSFGSVGMDNGEYNRDDEDGAYDEKDTREPLSNEERILEIELDDEMKNRLGEKSYASYQKLVSFNYETSKLTPSELRGLKTSLKRVFKSGNGGQDG